jgi:hypothetical protein
LLFVVRIACIKVLTLLLICPFASFAFRQEYKKEEIQIGTAIKLENNSKAGEQ